MLSDEAENFVRDYEVPYDMNLAEFYDYIRESVGYSAAEMASIFTAGSSWEKLAEFTAEDMGFSESLEDAEAGVPRPMNSVVLGQIIHEKFDRLIYLFDIFAERQFFLELLESKRPEAGVSYPRILCAAGTPPPQILDQEAESSIFDEAMGEFDDFAGDDSYDDE